LGSICSECCFRVNILLFVWLFFLFISFWSEFVWVVIYVFLLLGKRIGGLRCECKFFESLLAAKDLKISKVVKVYKLKICRKWFELGKKIPKRSLIRGKKLPLFSGLCY